MKLNRLFIILILIIIISPKPIVNAVESDLEINLYSTACIAIDAKSDFIFYENNKDEKMFPASTTKILTAIIIIENCNLDEKVIVTDSAISSIPDGYQSANLIAGEEVSIKDLLTMFLVHSANDCGYVLAEHYAGSVESFSEIMNNTAKNIGCQNSNFVNPSGIHNIEHYSTAYDLALIAKYCINNDIFRSIVSMSKCTISPTNKSESREYSNTNELINKNSKFYIEECIGIKTGYTKDAGNCLIACFSKNNLEVVCVLLGAPNIDNNYSSRFIDSKKIYEHIFSNYSYKNIVKKDDLIQTIEIKNASKKNNQLNLVAEKDVNLLLKNDFIIPDPVIKIEKNLYAPIKQHTLLGSISYNINNKIYSCNLISENDIEQNYNIYLILLIIFLIIIFMILIILILKRFQRKK